MGPEIQCLKCGTVIQSRHRHDMVSCSCGSISVDGGSDYTKITGHIDNIKFGTSKLCAPSIWEETTNGKK